MGIYTCFILDYPKQPHFPWDSCPTQSKPCPSGGNTSARPNFGRQHPCHSPVLHLSWCGATSKPWPMSLVLTWTHSHILMPPSRPGLVAHSSPQNSHQHFDEKTPSKTIFLSIWKRFALIDASNKSNELCHNAGLRRLISYSQAQILTWTCISSLTFKPALFSTWSLTAFLFKVPIS